MTGVTRGIILYCIMIKPCSYSQNKLYIRVLYVTSNKGKKKYLKLYFF